MADAELKEKKFGYVVQPPPCPHVYPVKPPLPPGPVPPGMTVQDWTTYINSYIDLRARQLYDKLKDLYSSSGGVIVDNTERAHQYILLKDENGDTHKVTIRNGVLQSSLVE